MRGYDNSRQMLEQAVNALHQDESLKPGIVEVEYGTAGQVPAGDESFDVALSINVGCALPSEGPVEQIADGTLVGHFKEMRRILKPGGFGVVTAPLALEEVFTTYADEPYKIAALRKILTTITREADLRSAIGSNPEILRATVVDMGYSFELIEEPGTVEMGRRILRKIPGLVVPNYMHNEDEYAAAIETAGLDMVSVDMPLLEPERYNPQTGLGLKYLSNNAFGIYLVQKNSRL